MNRVSGLAGPRHQEEVAEPELELGAIFAAYAERVGGWAARLAGPSLDPEELIREVFLIVRKQLKHFRGDARLSTWLYRITLNVVRDRRRREKRRWRFAGEPRAEHHTAYDSTLERERTEAVYHALDSLRERDRTLLILFEIEGLPGEQIARLLEVRLDTLLAQLQRAHERFRERILTQHPELAWRAG
jgi:RNA polymerase sigma-70 factor (ECF subfamily)